MSSKFRLTTMIQDVTVEILERFSYFLRYWTLIIFRTVLEVSQHDNLKKKQKKYLKHILTHK